MIPAAIAFVVRSFIKEPERWEASAKDASVPRIAELFTPENKRATISGLLMSIIALLTWWSCNAFIPVVATGLAQVAAHNNGTVATQVLTEQWKTITTYSFNTGGLIGSLLTIPDAKLLGRKWMFGIYFVLSSLATIVAFGAKVPDDVRIWGWLYFAIGLTVFGIFGSFTFYLPELFPTRLRATGSGFCYNAGRIITAIGPFLVGSLAAQKVNALEGVFQLLFLIGFIPLVGICLMPWVIETKGIKLSD